MAERISEETLINRQMIDSLRIILGKDPMYNQDMESFFNWLPSLSEIIWKRAKKND